MDTTNKPTRWDRPCYKCKSVYCGGTCTPSAGQATQPADAAQATQAVSEPVAHRQGCDALGGYGHGVGPCNCGAVPAPASASEPLQAMADNERELGLDYGLGASVAGAGEAAEKPLWQKYRDQEVARKMQPVYDALAARPVAEPPTREQVEAEALHAAANSQVGRPVADGEATPKLAAYDHLREHGQWPNGIVPDWSRDHCGQMNDMTVARAVIEELRAALARQAPAPLSQAVPAGFWLAPMEPDSEMVRLACDRWGFPSGTRMVYVKGYQAARDSWLSRHPQPQAVTEDARDGERLDWIEKRVCDVSRLGDSARTIRIAWNNGADHEFVGPHYHANWRAAVDAAMAREE